MESQNFSDAAPELAMLSAKLIPMAIASSAVGPGRDRSLYGESIKRHCFKLTRASLNFRKELLCPATKLESSRVGDLE